MSEQAGNEEFSAIRRPCKVDEFFVGDRVAMRQNFRVFCDVRGILLVSLTGEVIEVPGEGERYYRVKPDQAIYSTRGGVRGVYHPQKIWLSLPVALQLVYNQPQLPK